MIKKISHNKLLLALAAFALLGAQNTFAMEESETEAGQKKVPMIVCESEEDGGLVTREELETIASYYEESGRLCKEIAEKLNKNENATHFYLDKYYLKLEPEDVNKHPKLHETISNIRIRLDLDNNVDSNGNFIRPGRDNEEEEGLQRGENENVVDLTPKPETQGDQVQQVENALNDSDEEDERRFILANGSDEERDENFADHADEFIKPKEISQKEVKDSDDDADTEDGDDDEDEDSDDDTEDDDDADTDDDDDDAEDDDDADDSDDDADDAATEDKFVRVDNEDDARTIRKIAEKGGGVYFEEDSDEEEEEDSDRAEVKKRRKLEEEEEKVEEEETVFGPRVDTELGRNYYNEKHFVFNEDGSVDVKATISKIKGAAWYNPIRVMRYLVRKCSFGYWCYEDQFEDKALWKLHNIEVDTQIKAGKRYSTLNKGLKELTEEDKNLQRRIAGLTAGIDLGERTIRDTINTIVQGRARLDNLEAMMLAAVMKQRDASAQVLADEFFGNAEERAFRAVKELGLYVSKLKSEMENLQEACSKQEEELDELAEELEKLAEKLDEQEQEKLGELAEELDEQEQEKLGELKKIYEETRNQYKDLQGDSARGAALLEEITEEHKDALGNLNSLKAKFEELNDAKLLSEKQRRKHKFFATVASAGRNQDEDMESLKSEALSKAVEVSQPKYVTAIIADSNKQIEEMKRKVRKTYPTASEKRAAKKKVKDENSRRFQKMLEEERAKLKQKKLKMFESEEFEDKLLVIRRAKYGSKS